MKIIERLDQPGARSQLAVAASLLLLLTLLAALQYYWLGQLSAGEREHLKTALSAAAARYSQDLNREITRVYTAFLPAQDWQDNEKLSALAESYDRWRETVLFPGFVKAIFVITVDAEGLLNLTQLEPEAKKFVPLAWPEEMTPLRGQIQHLLAMPRRLSDAPSVPDVAMRLSALQSLNDETPALLLPLMEPLRIRENREFPIPMPSRFAVIALDPHCLRQEVLPALTQRHFAEEGRFSYELTIIHRHYQQQIVYQSGSQASSAGNSWNYEKADASIGLFALDIDEIRRLWRGRRQNLPLPNAVSFGARRTAREQRMRGNAPPAFPPPPIFTLAVDPTSGEQQGIWQMYIRHRAGSLEAAVESVRRRNLLISFSTLLLLSASISLLIISLQRARRLTQQQMDFVAGISHELHTPIAVIDSAAYNLAGGFMKNPEQIKKYGLLIRHQTRQLKEIIGQVLEFADVQAHRQRYELQMTSINQVIDDVLDSSQPLLDESGFRIEKDVPHELPAVMADARAVSRAIHNLLNNAMKYSGESRWIGIQAGVVEQGQETYIQITISDRGVGIPAEDLPHIFQPFYRGNEARAAQIHGNGLGLSLVKNIIEGHGGKVSVRSRRDAGSSFTLSLPVFIHISHQLSAINHQLHAEPIRMKAEN